MLQNTTILIADDAPINLVILSQVLKEANATVLTATNGKEVLATLENSKVDILLTDLQMPEMDGLETATCIRKSNEWYRTLPIIAITAETGESEIKNCYDVGINDFINKPVVPAIIYQKIAQALKGNNEDDKPVEEPTQAVAAYNLSYLTEVMNGEKQNLMLVVKNLQENAPLLLQQATESVALSKWNDVAADLHKLKGLTALFQMQSVTKTLLAAEQEAKSHTPVAEKLLESIKGISAQMPYLIQQISEEVLSS